MQELFVLSVIFCSLAFATYKIVLRFRSRMRRRRQSLAKKGWDIKPMFTYPDGTMTLGPSNHFSGHEGSRVIFVSPKWKDLPRSQWLFDKIWDIGAAEGAPIKKVRKDGVYAIVDEKGNVISDFYVEVKIDFQNIKVRKGRKLIPLTILVEGGNITLKEPCLLEGIILASFFYFRKW